MNLLIDASMLCLGVQPSTLGAPAQEFRTLGANDTQALKDAK